MTKLTYSKTYFEQLCERYRHKEEANNESLFNEFTFYWNEKGSLFARMKLIQYLKNL